MLYYKIQSLQGFLTHSLAFPPVPGTFLSNSELAEKVRGSKVNIFRIKSSLRFWGFFLFSILKGHSPSTDGLMEVLLSIQLDS